MTDLRNLIEHYRYQEWHDADAFVVGRSLLTVLLDVAALADSRAVQEGGPPDQMSIALDRLRGAMEANRG